MWSDTPCDAVMEVFLDVVNSAADYQQSRSYFITAVDFVQLVESLGSKLRFLGKELGLQTVYKLYPEASPGLSYRFQTCRLSWYINNFSQSLSASILLVNFPEKPSWCSLEPPGFTQSPCPSLTQTVVMLIWESRGDFLCSSLSLQQTGPIAAFLFSCGLGSSAYHRELRKGCLSLLTGTSCLFSHTRPGALPWREGTAATLPGRVNMMSSQARDGTHVVFRPLLKLLTQGVPLLLAYI